MPLLAPIAAVADELQRAMQQAGVTPDEWMVIEKSVRWPRSHSTAVSPVRSVRAS